MNDLATLEQQIQAHWLRLRRAAIMANARREHWAAEVRAAGQRALCEALEGVHSRLQAATAALPWLTLPWDDPAWAGYVPLTGREVPGSVRLGRLHLPVEGLALDFPAVVPLIGRGHLLVECDEATQPAALALLQAATLRLIASWPAGAVRLVLMDPTGLGANLAAFLRLPQFLRGERVYSRAGDIEQALQETLAHIENITQTRLLGTYATLEEYNAQVGEIAAPYHFLVLADFPAGFDERQAQALLTIARNGPRAGVYTLALVRTDLPGPRDFSLAELERLATVATPQGDGTFAWSEPDLGACVIVPDPTPPIALANAIFDAVGQAAQEQTAVGLPFARLVIPREERWTGDSTQGLTVPIGVNGAGEVHAFSLGQGVVQHALIAGLPRSGKTNLLHVLITQLALHYPPEELELYLLDFKEAVEFQDYARPVLPHLRALALEGEREFGVSVLNRLRRELEWRAARCREVGARTVQEYRRKSGARLSRVLLIMDEFQVLFAEDDRLSATAGQVLNDLVRRGPALGLHVILSSQSPTGNFVSSRDTYEQISLRAAFLCQEMTARQVLGESGEVVQRLERPGEAYFNDAQGRKDRNTFVRVAWFPSDERQRYLETIQERAAVSSYAPPEPARVFEKARPARLIENQELQRPPDPKAPICAWLGEPIEIKPPTAAVFQRQSQSNLLIVGQDEEQAHGILAGALLSLCAQRPPEAAEFHIAAFSQPWGEWSNLFARIQAAVPHRIEIAGRRDALAFLDRLSESVKHRGEMEDPSAEPDLFFLVVGLHRFRELQETDRYGKPGPAAQQLRSLCEAGPEVGVHVLLWSDTVRSVTRVLERNLNLFDLRVALAMGEDDSNALLDGPYAARLSVDRAYFWDREWGQGLLEKFKPYSLPTAEEIAILGQRLQVRWKGDGQHGQ